jgi:hypothetical protein
MRTVGCHKGLCHINMFCEVMLSADSRAIVSFSGDTPTTIRIFNAFATESIILTPDAELPLLLRLLPFRSVVPWHDIIRPIPTQRFDRAPVETLADVARNETLLARQRTLALMRRHRRDVLWDERDSQAFLHLIREAASFDSVQTGESAHVRSVRRVPRGRAATAG